VSDDKFILARLSERVAMLEVLISNNREAFLTTGDQTRDATRTLDFLRDGIASGDIDPASVMLGHMITHDVLWPMIHESISKYRGLSDSKILWARAMLPDANDEARALILNSNSSSIKRFRRKRRQQEGVPAKPGRPAKDEKER
jgi:hypothetical protein